MTEKDYKKILNNIKKYRKLRGLTQEQMAEKTNVDAQYYSQLEQGRRKFTLDKIIDCCDVFNISVDNIISTVSPDKQKNKELIEDIDKKLPKLSHNALLVIDILIDDFDVIK